MEPTLSQVIVARRTILDCLADNFGLFVSLKIADFGQSGIVRHGIAVDTKRPG